MLLQIRIETGWFVMATIIWPLLIYWLVVFVACFVVVEIGQDQLYDEVTPHVGLKVAGGTLLIAVLLTALRDYGFPASFESMFTSNMTWTVLQGVVWFRVFILIFQFHPWHALGLGIVTMLLVSGLATMGVESILSRPASRSAATRAFCPRSGPAIARTRRGSTRAGCGGKGEVAAMACKRSRISMAGPVRDDCTGSCGSGRIAQIRAHYLDSMEPESTWPHAWLFVASRWRRAGRQGWIQNTAEG